MSKTDGHPAEKDARSTHVVYRIDSGFRYQETPCFCSATSSHSVLDTRATPPAKTEGDR